MRRRGFTLTEMVVGIALTTMVAMAAISMLIQSTQAFAMTTTQTKISNYNAIGMRYVGEQLRKAYSVTIVSNVRVDYMMPKLNTTKDADTKELEYIVPMVGDGTTRSFRVDFSTGNLTDTFTGKTMCRNLVSTDPDPASSQYKKTVAPFQATTIGSNRAIALTFITQDQVGVKTTYVRLKSTTMVRNLQ